jgi:activating signal cointegrator complex subunit 2
MAAAILKALPPVAPFPKAEWRTRLAPKEWSSCLETWTLVLGAYLSLSQEEFQNIAAKDDSIAVFISSYIKELAFLSPDVDALGDVEKGKQLRKGVYFLLGRIYGSTSCPNTLLQWDFLLDLAQSYTKTQASKVLLKAWQTTSEQIMSSLNDLRTKLIKDLDAGIKGRPDALAQLLKRLNHLLHASPEAASFMISGADFLDSLISCYRLMNPPLRSAIIATSYLCIISLTEGQKPNFSALIDLLYAMQAAAEAHKAGPTSANDSLVPELITSTPLLKQIKERIDAQAPSFSARAMSVLTSLEGFKKAQASARPKRLVKRQIDRKGKKPVATEEYGHGSTGDHQIHVHKMSLVTQVQDLFPDLGAGFIVKLLDEYNDNVEEVIAALLEDNLPPHLADLDRTLPFPSSTSAAPPHVAHMSPRPTPPGSPGFVPSRRNKYDELAVATGKLHFGKRQAKTADDVLADKSSAPQKAAILAALAAFDSDDDERDDTYDVADVGASIDITSPEEVQVDRTPNADSANDEALYRAWKMSPAAFGRDAQTRRSKERAALKEETGMADEAIEGWAIMLSRDSRKQRHLEAKFSAFTPGQNQLQTTRWAADSENTDSDSGNVGRGGFRGGRGRGRGRGGGGGGRGGGNVAGPTGDAQTERARHNKEANKGSRANHNRRDQRAKKMARGGFPPAA